jgi:acetyltransferase
VGGLHAAARLKPVIVMKAGRHNEGSRAAVSHTGALLGADDVFDAALARAGAVRVLTIEQLFAAAQILSSGARVRGNRLAIVTNGGGPGIIAADRAAELGVAIPQLSDATSARLGHIVPPARAQQNPIDLLADADPERYREAIAACLDDQDIDGVLAMLAPQAQTDPVGVAKSIAELSAKGAKPVLGCWLGEAEVAAARELLSDARLPHFQSPEAAVEAFGYLANYRRNQELLLQVPGPLSLRNESNVQGARLIIEGALAEGRHTLTSMESKALLTAFGLPVVRTVEAHSASEALILAESLGYPVAMKISSPDIAHKSSVGGVRLNIANAHAVRAAYTDLLAAAQAARPGASITRVTVESMHDKPNGRELIVGVVRDPVFGPVISFGAGGTMVELIRDRAVALPPLNAFIARDLIQRTRVASTLHAYHNLPAVDMRALEQALLRVSDLVCKLPYIQELDINPLVVDENGVLAVDALFTVDTPPAATGNRYSHMAIHPYPLELISSAVLNDDSEVTVRPIRPEDAELEQEFVQNLSQESKFYRFMETLNELSPQMLVRLTQIDYDREMALIAVQQELGRERLLGVARYTLNPDGESCEFALAVADEWQHKGLGSRLLNKLIETAASRNIKRIEGEVLAANRKMLKLMQKLGFSITTSPEDYTIRHVSKPL